MSLLVRGARRTASARPKAARRRVRAAARRRCLSRAAARSVRLAARRCPVRGAARRSPRGDPAGEVLGAAAPGAAAAGPGLAAPEPEVPPTSRALAPLLEASIFSERTVPVGPPTLRVCPGLFVGLPAGAGAAGAWVVTFFAWPGGTLCS